MDTRVTGVCDKIFCERKLILRKWKFVAFSGHLHQMKKKITFQNVSLKGSMRNQNALKLAKKISFAFRDK